MSEVFAPKKRVWGTSGSNPAYVQDFEPRDGTCGVFGHLGPSPTVVSEPLGFRISPRWVSRAGNADPNPPLGYVWAGNADPPFRARECDWLEKVILTRLAGKGDPNPPFSSPDGGVGNRDLGMFCPSPCLSVSARRGSPLINREPSTTDSSPDWTPFPLTSPLAEASWKR